MWQSAVFIMNNTPKCKLSTVWKLTSFHRLSYRYLYWLEEWVHLITESCYCWFSCLSLIIAVLHSPSVCCMVLYIFKWVIQWKTRATESEPVCLLEIYTGPCLHNESDCQFNLLQAEIMFSSNILVHWCKWNFILIADFGSKLTFTLGV